MRSQIRFVMHPLDEAEFIAKLLEDESVGLIDGPRWPAATPLVTRSLDRLTATSFDGVPALTYAAPWPVRS